MTDRGGVSSSRRAACSPLVSCPSYPLVVVPQDEGPRDRAEPCLRLRRPGGDLTERHLVLALAACCSTLHDDRLNPVYPGLESLGRGDEFGSELSDPRKIHVNATEGST